MYYDFNEAGKRIQMLRTQKGYTQEQLADALNIDRSFLSRVEAGRKGCSVDLFVQLSDFFSVSLDYLIVGKLNNAGRELLIANVDELIGQLEAFWENL